MYVWVAIDVDKRLSKQTKRKCQRAFNTIKLIEFPSKLFAKNLP